MYENGSMSPADMAAVVRPNYNDGMGMGGFGSWFWVIILFLFFGAGGWGNGWGGNGGTNNIDRVVQNGFDQSAVISAINGVNTAVNQLGLQICNGFNTIGNTINTGIASVNAALNNGFAQAEIAANGRQMNNMTQIFGVQTAIGDVKYAIANEGCVTRNQSMMNTRDVIDAVNNVGQKLMDKACQLELDNYKGQLSTANRQIDALQEEITRLGLANQMQTGFANEVDNLYNRLSNCPVPTTPVYGRTPIFTCNQAQNPGCPCGYNA